MEVRFSEDIMQLNKEQLNSNFTDSVKSSLKKGNAVDSIQFSSVQSKLKQENTLLKSNREETAVIPFGSDSTGKTNGAEGASGPTVFKPASEAAAYDMKSKRGKTLKTVSKIASAIERSTINEGDKSDTAGMAAYEAVRVWHKAPRVLSVALRQPRNIIHGSVYAYKVVKDFRSGAYTGGEAAKAVYKKSGTALSGLVKSGWQVTKNAAVNFEGSEDLGIQTVTKPKDTIVAANRGIKAAKAVGKAPQKARQRIKRIKQTGQKAVQMAKYTAAVTKKIFSNPVVLKGIGIGLFAVLIAAVLVACVSAVSSLFLSFTLVSEDKELTKTFLYITELDNDLNYEISKVEKASTYQHIDEFHYFYNGVEIDRDRMTASTDANNLLNYLNVKYEDYTLDGILNLFGVKVRDEVTKIHEQLYQLTYEEATEEIEHTKKTINDKGVEVISTWYEEIVRLDVRLTAESVSDFLHENSSVYFDKDQEEQYDNLAEVGSMSMRQELYNPFEGIKWRDHVSCRFGWRLDPFTGEKDNHYGLDIAMPEGTPIHCVMSGTVTDVSYDEDYGNNFTVTNDKRSTLYAHCSRIDVAEGDEVNYGDIVAYVGSTGNSTGAHLHLEFKKDGTRLNPAFYLAD